MFFSLGVLKYVVCLCSGCDGCCVFCLFIYKCVFFTFAPPIIPLIYVPGHDLNSNVSVNLDASLSFLLLIYLE